MPQEPMKTRRRLRRIAAVGAVVWMGVIFAMSSLPGSDIPAGQFSSLGHLGEFAILGALLAYGLAAWSNRRLTFATLALASMYGVTDEIHQLFVAQRCADPVDWLVDTLGAALGIAIVVIVMRRMDTTKA